MRSVATPGIVNAGMAQSIKNKPKVNDISSMTKDSNERLAFAENGEKGAQAEAQATPVKSEGEGGNWLSNSKFGKLIQKGLKPMQNQDDLEGYKNNPNYDQELANTVRTGEANKNEASVQTTADAANQARQQKEEQNELRRQQREAARNQQLATEEQPDNSPEALATAHGRIVAGKATDDDLREDFENFKNKSDVYADGRQPGPKTMNEWKRLGLVDENGNIVENEAAPEQPAEQPVAEANAESQPEQPTEQPATEAANVEQPTKQPAENADAPLAVDGAPEETKTPEQQEQTERVKNELDGLSEDKRKEYFDKVFQELEPDEKERFRSIFDALNKKAIDPATANYFVADALARWGKNMANIMQANQQNAMWANIKSGNQVNPDIDIGPNEWQKYLKTNWENAQALKQEGRKQQLKDTLNRANTILEEQGKDWLMYEFEPQMFAKSYIGKMDPTQLAKYVLTKGYVDGKTRSMEDAANVADFIGNLDITSKVGLETLRSLYLDNEGKVNLNKITNVDAMHAENKARLDEESQELENKKTRGEIDQQAYDKEAKRLDNERKKIDNEAAQIEKDTQKALQKYKIEGEELKNMKLKYGGSKFKLGFNLRGIAEAGAEVDGVTLANAVGDIDQLIRDGFASKLQ